MMKRVELSEAMDTCLVHQSDWKERLTLKLRNLVRAQNLEDRCYMILHLSHRLAQYTYAWYEELG